MRIHINVNLKVNRLIRNFVLIDLFLFGGWGLIAPIFSIFIIEKIANATLITAGLAAAIYWILKSLLQLPLADYLDKRPGEKDDFYILLLGLLVAGFSAMAFILVSRIWELYLVQVVHAIAFALYTPSWSSIFSRHLDKEKVSFDWSLDSTSVGLAGGITGLIGAVIAQWLGFNALFLFAGFLSLVAIPYLIAVPDLVLPRRTSNKTEMIIPKDHLGE